MAIARELVTMRDRISLKRLLIATSLTVACLTPINSAGKAQSTSTVSGCITDTTGRPLPGATVDVGGDDRHRIVQTDGRGCYAVPDVPAGPHFVFARLPGFISATLDNLNIEPGRSQKIDFQMRFAGICECIAFPDTVAKLWDDADAVVRVRLIEHDPANPDIKYRASVMRSWKQGFIFNTTETLTFLRHPQRDEVEPYVVGQDFVLFLKWSSAEQVFVRMSSGDGTVAAFAIEDGRIHSAPLAAYAGARAEPLLDELAAFAGR
jgi:hypothetical protein